MGPYCRFLQVFCNKKLIFKFSDFRRIQRKTSPKSWTETRRSMCDHRDANRTLSQLSYRPILPLFAGFCNKKLIFKFSDFRRIQRKTSPKSWTETRRSMCDHRDANRTLSQLSYKPEYEVVWLRYVRLALSAELQARTLILYTDFPKKQEGNTLSVTYVEH